MYLQGDFIFLWLDVLLVSWQLGTMKIEGAEVVSGTGVEAEPWCWPEKRCVPGGFVL